MKKCIILYLIVSINFTEVNAFGKTEHNGIIKAVWFSYLDFGILKDNDEESFRVNVNSIYQNLIDQGLNTIIVHVRSFSDAIYPSAIYPWAEFITSNPEGMDYDPLKIMIEIAHEKNIKFEAWINPYRVSTSSSKTNYIKNINAQCSFLELLNNPGNSIIDYDNAGETCLTLNPANEDARKLVLDGVKEIIQNYDVYGIHFDDYFYVDQAFPSVNPEIRCQNVNNLVKKVYNLIKTFDKDITFGISPAGNIQNCLDMGADVKTWLSEEGYIDYIMPQIYWSDQYGVNGDVTMFSNRLNEWDTLNTEHIKMYAGLALYNVIDLPDNDFGWQISQSNLKDQWDLARGLGYSGYALFRYDNMTNIGAIQELSNLKDKKEIVNISYY